MLFLYVALHIVFVPIKCEFVHISICYLSTLTNRDYVIVLVFNIPSCIVFGINCVLSGRTLFDVLMCMKKAIHP